MTPVLGDLVQISFETLVVLFLLVLVSIQALFINLRLDALNEQFEERFNVIESKMDEHMGTADDVATDGGHLIGDDSDSQSTDSSGAGALSGAAAGAALGAPFGPGAVVGGAIMGAIVGDEVEKSSIRNRQRRNLEAKIVRKLLMKMVDRTNPVRPAELYSWFPADEEEDIKVLLDRMVDDANVPVATTDSGRVYITDFEDAFTILDSRGW